MGGARAAGVASVGGLPEGSPAVVVGLGPGGLAGASEGVGLGRRLTSRRIAVLAAGLLLALLIWPVSRLISESHHALAISAAHRRGLAKLPLAAQAPVSAALGAASPAYAARVAGGSVFTSNAGQHLRARFDRSGAQVRAGAESFGLELTSVGNGGALSPLTSVAPRADANRVVYSYPAVSESFVNGPLGLEQRFTVARAPAHGAGPLTLSLSLSGDVRARASEGGRGLVLTGAGGHVVRYRGLAASDSRGRVLKSWLSMRGGRLLVRVDARGARYPITIDPLIQQGPPLTDLNGEGEVGDGAFGAFIALSSDGRTVLVGAPYEYHQLGAAFVFVRSGSTWVQQAELKGEGNGEIGKGNFGGAVALSADGDTAAIGAEGDGDEGAVWVFVRSDTVWTEQTKLVADCTSACANQGTGESTSGGVFGDSVALSSYGNTLIAGQTYDETSAGAYEQGAAWVFTRSGENWTEQTKLVGDCTSSCSNEGTGESTYGGFGYSVALAGDGSTALVGAIQDESNAGATWAFTRSGSSWSEQAKLVGDCESGCADEGTGETGEGDFGSSVALSEDGTTALIGAGEDNDGKGAAWVFTSSGSSWTQQTKLVGDCTTSCANNGTGEVGQGELGWRSVALSADGGRAVIGADGDASGVGAAWVFERSGSNWTQEGSKLVADCASSCEHEGTGEVGAAEFGAGAAMSASTGTVMIGAPSYSENQAGVWAFNRPPTVEPADVTEALFVAGGVARLTNVRDGTEELILEKTLQQIYADEPTLPPATAEGYIAEMKALLASSFAPSKASLQVMTGNQRVLAILAALKEHDGKLSAELPPAAKLALTHVASVALAGSSNVFANAESPKYFEPLADERSNLLYTTFSPATVLRATWELAQRNPRFGLARDAVWRSKAEESVFSWWPALFGENKALSNSAFNGLKTEIEVGEGALYSTPEQLEELFHEGQQTTQEQTCEHKGGSGAGIEIGTEQPDGGDTISGVPRLRCTGGALWEASTASPKSGKTPAEVGKKGETEAHIIAEQQAVMFSAAELLEPSDRNSSAVLAAAGQSQTQITEAEQKWSTYEAEQKTRNNIKGGLEAAAGLGSSIFDFVHGDPQEGVAGLIGVAFKVYGLVEENLVEPPPEPEEIALEDMKDLRKQLSGFQQYTQEAFHAVNVQVAQLTAQVARDNNEVKLELGSLSERLAAEQQTIFALQNEIQTLFSTEINSELQSAIAESIGWLQRTGEVLPGARFQESLIALEKYATEVANGDLVNNEAEPYTFAGAERQLTSEKNGEPESPSDSTSYLVHFPVEQEWFTGTVPATVANTKFWSESARAYAQLMLENPSHVSPNDKTGLKTVENEGLTLESAQNTWAADSGAPKTGNGILDDALQAVEQTATGTEVDGQSSVAVQLEEAAAKSLEQGLAPANGGTAGNPTDLDLWGNPKTITSGELTSVENEKYSALTEPSVLSKLPAQLINGVRLGVVGAKGSHDAWELEFGSADGSCTHGLIVKLDFHGAEQDTDDTSYGTDCGLSAGVEEKLAYSDLDAMSSIEEEAFSAQLRALKSELGPAEALGGARALVQSYVKLGLPQAVSADIQLQSDIEGAGAEFLDPTAESPRPLPDELTALVESWQAGLRNLAYFKANLEASYQNYEVTKEACNNGNNHSCSELAELKTSLEKYEGEYNGNGGNKLVETDATEKVKTLTTGWATQIAQHVLPFVEDKAAGFAAGGTESLSEQSPLLESTINRLRLTRDLLDESKAPTAETISPTGIGDTEATVNGELNSYGEEIESCKFEYGSTESYGQSVGCATVPATSDESSVVSAKVTNWTKGGGFHERLVVTTWAGTTYGQDVKVQLSESGSGTGGSGAAPTVVTGAASKITKRQAVLQGTVDPNGVAVAKCWATIQEEAGKKESLSFPCVGGIGTGHAATPVVVTGRKLVSGTKYIYQLHAENVEGARGEGLPQKFETLAKKVRKK